MNKERAFIAGLVCFLIIGSLIFTKCTDCLYLAGALAFFALCVIYAEWCERL